MSMLHLTYQVPGDDFTRAGEASGGREAQAEEAGLRAGRVRRVRYRHVRGRRSTW